MFEGVVMSFTTTAKTAYTPAVLPQRETGPLRSHEFKTTSCELQSLSSERLDESKLTKFTRTGTTLEWVPGGILADSARDSCGLLPDILLLLPDALFTYTGVSHEETASCELRRFVSLLQCYYQTLWRDAQSIRRLRKMFQAVRHVLSELYNCLLPAKSLLPSASSTS
jgi:hypothetical protein